MSGDANVQFWEGLGVRFPGLPNRKLQLPRSGRSEDDSALSRFQLCGI